MQMRLLWSCGGLEDDTEDARENRLQSFCSDLPLLHTFHYLSIKMFYNRYDSLGAGQKLLVHVTVYKN